MTTTNEGHLMKKLKKTFEENPILVITLATVAATAVAALLSGTAKIIDASAYAYRASKL